MAQIGRYRYSVIMNFITDSNEEITIPAPCISYIVVDYDYETLNMPIIFVVMNVESNLYNKIVVNSDKDTSKIMLNITKYDTNSSNTMNTDYIKAMFTYFVPNNPNYTKDLDINDDINAGGAYKRMTIGLMKMDLVDYNKKIINGIFKNTSMVSLVHKCTSHMPMVIEPFTYDSNIANIIVPPIDTLSGVIEFLNEYQSFYDKGYRYFMDFDRTYLLSTSGNSIDAHDGSYSNISFDIQSTIMDAAQQSGVVKDDDNSTYVIYADGLSTDVKLNNVTEKIANHITGVTTEGEVVERDLNINNTGKEVKNIFRRIPNDNKNIMDVMKNELENTAVVLSIQKTDLDSSIITPNKSYTISNFQDYSSFNGNFILANKKEVFKQSDGDFASYMVVGLRRVQ